MKLTIARNSYKSFIVVATLTLVGFNLINNVLSGGAENTKFVDKIIRNCPREFTYSVLRELLENGSLNVAKKIVDSLEFNEKGVLYGLKQIDTDTDVSEMKILLPDINNIEKEKMAILNDFLSYGYYFDCRDIKRSSNFLFWIVRHLELEFISAAEVLSIIKNVLVEGSSRFGVESFIPVETINSVKMSDIIAQKKNDKYPSVTQINSAIKRFTSTKRFIDPNGPLDLPDIMNIPRASLEDKRLRSKIYLLQKSGYFPDIREKSQMHTIRYIIRTTRYYLNRYISPELIYSMWSVVYNAMTGLKLPEYQAEMDLFILKKTNSDTWPHEADVLDAISYSLNYHGINTKPLSIHSEWYNKLKKGGYMLSFPRNVKTARWFCRFFQHNLHIFINPYLQFSIWKKAVQNLLELNLGQINISNDKCFFREDPKFPWPSCHKINKDDPNYLPFEHDRVLDNLSYEFSRLIHNINPSYPFSDICEVTRKLLLSGSYRREVRQPTSKVKHTVRMRKLERKIYLKRLVHNYNSNKINEPYIGPSNEMLFFFRHYIENDIKISDKVIDRVVNEKFMDEDLEDLIKTRNFILDCTRIYSSLPLREEWNDQEIKEIPARGKKAISIACGQLFYAKPKCRFDLIPPYHPSRDSTDMLSGEFSLRIFSYLRSIGILNVLPEQFCKDSIRVLANIFGIESKEIERIRRANLRKLKSREKAMINALLKFKTLNRNEIHVSNVKKMNEMLDRIIKLKLQYKLGIKTVDSFDFDDSEESKRYFGIRDDLQKWEIDELQDLVNLNKKFKFYNSFKKFPVHKFKRVCENQLDNLALGIDGIYSYMNKRKLDNSIKENEIVMSKRKKEKKSIKSITSDNISKDITYELCLSLGTWQESIRKRVKNYIEFLWLKMNNRNTDFRYSNMFSLKLGSEAELLTEKGVTRDINIGKEIEISKLSYEPTASVFYTNLSTSLRERFPQYEFKLPNTEPLEPEVKRLRKLGYECLFRPNKNEGMLMAEECIKYLYRYGLYILNGIVLDVNILYDSYLKAFRDTGMELITFIPDSLPIELKYSLVKTSLNDYNFHRFESLCSLNEIDSDAIWSQLFKTVESISTDMIINLHSFGLILPGTDDSLLFPKRTQIRHICEFVLNILNPNKFTIENEDIGGDGNNAGFFNGQIRKPEYIKGYVWHEVNKISSASVLNVSQTANRRFSRALMTVYFVQSCIREYMLKFKGLHYIIAAILCRKTKEWRTCDEPINNDMKYNYLSDVTLEKTIEEKVAKRLIKGVFVDIISFELLERAIVHLWINRNISIPDDVMPMSYKRFCQISVRIYDYLTSQRFDNFNDACIHSLEVDNMFRKEQDGEIYTIKRSLAAKICSETYWGQECSNSSVITESALLLHKEVSNILKSSMHVLPLAPFCNLSYEMAFSRDPITLCSGNKGLNDKVRAKIGTVLYSRPEHEIEKDIEDIKRKENIRLYYGDVVPPEKDPSGILGSVLRTHSLVNLYVEGLKGICEKASVSIRDCSLIEGFKERHFSIFENKERSLKLNEESLRLFYPKIKKNNRNVFYNDIPVRVATFVDICELGVSTFELSSELFNTVCVASFGRNSKSRGAKTKVDKLGEMVEEYGPEKDKYGEWASNILYCSSTSRWKSCSGWSERNIAKFDNVQTLKLSVNYINTTPLLKAMIDFMTIFITSNMSLFLSGANTQLISEDKDDLRYISYIKDNYDFFCEASVRLYTYNELIISNKFEKDVIISLRGNDVSYSEIRGEKASFGVPYLFFNFDCPNILSKQILNFMDKIGDGYDPPKQLGNDDLILEFSVRVCRKHFSWMNCLFSEEILNVYSPIEISTFEYVASAMYNEYIVSDLIKRKSIKNRNMKTRPLMEEFNIFCRISTNIIPRQPNIMSRHEIEFEIINTLPSNMKKFGQFITNAFIDSYKKYNRGTQFLRSRQTLKDKKSDGFSFT
ncbi:signal peptide protein [Cryptosporidium xiaoi]|uniref:Signal peptide protein n=1 Tax=Cryptosporidium xiaoi TaxID=659607 RepID=A0AAV9XZI2_9CRYT